MRHLLVMVGLAVGFVLSSALVMARAARETGIDLIKRIKFWTLFVLAPVLAAGPAAASTSSGAEFQSLYDKVLDYVQGLPGIITAIVILVFGIWRSFFSGAGPLYFMGSVLAAAAIFIIPTIASGMGGAIF